MDYLTISVLLFFVSLLCWYLKYFYECSRLKGVSGPSVLPFFGNALILRSPTQIVSGLFDIHKQFNGKTFRIFVGTLMYVFINEAKHVEKILTSSVPLKKSKPYDFLSNWLGSGLLTSYGRKWAKHRKIITPAYHFKILEDFVDVFNESNKRLISKLTQKLHSKSFDVYPYVTRCALDIICETAMGTSVNAQEDLNSEYVNAVAKVGMIVIKRSFSPLLQNNTFFKFSSEAQEERKYLRILHEYTNKIIKSRRLETISNRNETKTNSNDEFGIKKKKAFLDLLLEYQQQDPTFTDEDIREEVDTFTFEGHETTATTIAFAIYCLAKHPKVQARALEEVKAILNDDPERDFTFKDLQEMKYLEMVIKETLRLYTTVPLYGRHMTQDFNMDGIILPKGVMVTIYAFGIHRDPAYFENPEEFNPERFSIENSARRSPFCFLPFSAGPRNCIGQKFAMLETKSTLASLLRKFNILMADPEIELVLRNDLVLKSDTGINIRLKERVL